MSTSLDGWTVAGVSSGTDAGLESSYSTDLRENKARNKRNALYSPAARSRICAVVT